MADRIVSRDSTILGGKGQDEDGKTTFKKEGMKLCRASNGP